MRGRPGPHSRSKTRWTGSSTSASASPWTAPSTMHRFAPRPACIRDWTTPHRHRYNSMARRDKEHASTALRVAYTTTTQCTGCRTPMLAHEQHRARCAKSRLFFYFGPISPDGQGDNCVPVHRTAQFLIQSKHSDKAVFHSENAGLLSKSAVFALQTYASRAAGGLQGVHRTANFPLGAVPALCRNAPICNTCLFFSLPGVRVLFRVL